jgi:RNA polymerase sigma-70 factor (ECF subfamily)
MTESDEQLIARMAARDEAALAELYRRYAPYLAALSRRMLQDRDEVQQCVQDAFYRAWEAAGRFDSGRASVKTWLATIAHRVTLNRLRGRRPNPLPLEAWDAPTRAADPVEQVGLKVAVAALEHDERELIELAFYRGHSHQELADLTGRPLGSVKSKLRGALHKLRDRLGDSSNEGGEPK